MPDIFHYLSPKTFIQELAVCSGYSLVEKIGEGGMAAVYLAISPAQSVQRVALKIAKPELVEAKGVALERFEREIGFQSSLDSPHVVKLLSSGLSPEEKNGRQLPWFTMNLVKGRSLADKLVTWKRLTQVEVARLGKQICLGLASIHKSQMVHRDLKPSNILLDITNSERALIGDFGLARSKSTDLHSITNGHVGTFGYIAPEIWDNPEAASALSDLYSVGCILYECLTGSKAFKDNPLASKNTPRIHPCDVDSRFNRGLAELIYRLMDPDPQKRCDNALVASREFEIAGMCIADIVIDSGCLPGLTDHSTCAALSEVARQTFFLPEFRGASQTTLLLGLAGQKLATRKLHRRIERFVDTLVWQQSMSSAERDTAVNVAISEAEKTFLSLEKRVGKTLEELQPNEKFEKFKSIHDKCFSACTGISAVLKLLQEARHNVGPQLTKVHDQVTEMLYGLMRLEIEAANLEVFVSDLLEGTIAQLSTGESGPRGGGFYPFLKENRIKESFTVHE